MKISIPDFRTGYNYDRDSASDASGLMCADPSLAQQQFRDDADINTIVKRFNLTGQLPENVSVPQYRDFEEVYDFHSALNLVKAAESAFMAMPAHVRAMFGDDPGAFVDFASDPSNYEAAVKLGLALPKDSKGGPAGGTAGPGVSEAKEGALPPIDQPAAPV